MKKLFLSLAIMSYAMGMVAATSVKSLEAELAQCKSEKTACQKRINSSLQDMAKLSERIARVESAIIRQKDIRFNQELSQRHLQRQK